MRCLIFVFLFVSSAFALYDLRSSPFSSVVRAKVPNLALQYGASESRYKRDIRLRPLDDPGFCLHNCTIDLQERLSTLNETDSEEERAIKLCKALDPVDSCYQACPESQFRTLLTDFLPLMKQPCLLGIDKFGELKNAITCINSTGDLVTQRCSPQCNDTASGMGVDDVESGIHLSVEPSYVIFDDDKKKNTEGLRAVCKLLTCEQQCNDRIIKETCGQFTAEVDRKITSSIFGAMIKLFKDVDAAEEPEECRPLL